MLRICSRCFGRAEESVTNGFHSPPVARQAVFVLLEPERDGRRHLRCGRGRAFAVLANLRTLFEDRPGNVWSVGCDGRRHATIRSPATLELSVCNVVIRLTVGHHAGDCNRTVLSCWVNY